MHEKARTIEGIFFPAGKSEFTCFIQIDSESTTKGFAASTTNKNDGDDNLHSVSRVRIQYETNQEDKIK